MFATLAVGSVGEVLAVGWFAGLMGGVVFGMICRMFGGTVQATLDVVQTGD